MFSYKEKFSKEIIKERIPVNSKQVEYELTHLKHKLEKRDPERFKDISNIAEIEINNIFRIIEGEIEKWERTY